MHKLYYILTLGLTFLAQATATHGEIAFDTVEKVLFPDLGQKQISASYTFTNHGAKDVAILKTSASCGCTVAKAEMSVIPPGGTGTINGGCPTDR